MKKLLSGIIVLAMLVSTIFVPASASTGKLNVNTDVVKYYNDGTALTGITVNAGISVVDGALCFDNTSGASTDTKQSKFQAFPADTESKETYGALSFRVNADSIDTEAGGTGGIVLIMKDDVNNKELHAFIIRKTMGMGATGSYGANFNDGLAFDTENWYTVGIVFNKNQSLDYYIDGVYQRNSKFAGEWGKNATTLQLITNLIGKSKISIDNLTWSKYTDDGFFAQNADGKTAYAGGSTVKVKFSEPLAKAEMSDVKLYECATGAEVTGAVAEFNGEYLNVTLPSGLKEGAEYRIEMNDFVGATGRTLKTDNIYFNCALGGSEPGATYYVKAETFADYANTSANKYTENNANPNVNYYQPTGWHLKQRWVDQNKGVVMAQDSGDSHGTAMQVGKTMDASTTYVDPADGKTKAKPGASSKPGVYLPFGEKIANGVLTISYDMKPQYLSDAGQYGGHINPNLIMMVYPDTPTSHTLTGNGDGSGIQESYVIDTANGGYKLSNNKATSCGYGVAGIVGYNIVSAKSNIYDVSNRKTTNQLFNVNKTLTMTDVESEVAAAYPDAAWKKVSGNDWYNVKVEFDFDNNKITWYLNGDKKDESTTLMSELELSNGISGLSFGQAPNNNSALTLIDNVVVTKTLQNQLSEESDVFADNFDTFENNTANGKQLWTAIAEDGVEAGFSPKGWAVHQIWTSGANLRQYGNIIKSAEGKSGNGLKLGKHIINEQSKAEAPILYQKFEQAYTDGVLNISYDVKAEKLANAGDSAVAKKLTDINQTTDGWGLTSGTTYLAPRQFTFSVMNDDFSSIFAEGFVNSLPAYGSWNTPYLGFDVFGIQNGKFAAFTAPIFKLINNGTAGDYAKEYETVGDVKYYRYGVGREEVTVGEWYNIKHIVDIDNDLVTTFINDIPVATVALTALSPKLAGTETKTVTGFRIGGDQNMYGSEIIVDNVVVTRQEYAEPEAKGGVMQVRFADYHSDMYGVASSQTTLTEAIGVSFWAKSIDAPDESNFELYETNAPSNTIGFNGSFDSETDVYLMELEEYLSNNTSYTLKIKDLTLAGAPLADYTMTFTTNEEGELIIEPVYIKHNNVQATEGTLAENDTLTSSLRIINTTGKSENFAFSMAVYGKDTSLTDFDFREITLDGITTKSADIEVGFKLDATDAANTSSARVFLWDGMTSMKPITNFGEFVNK